MLVASLDGSRKEASAAERGEAYVCPHCMQSVILKRGRIRVAHFAHKPPTECTWAKGETHAHLQAKKYFRDAFVARGLRAEVEFVVPSLPNDRRADVMVWSPKGQKAAIELQHTSIGIDEIEKRAFSYARQGIPHVWIPFLASKALSEAVPLRDDDRGDLFIERYSARPFERWAHAFHLGRLWLYDAKQNELWRGHFDDHRTWVDYADWCGADGEAMSAGGFHRTSKRYKELTLWGPYIAGQIKIRFKKREAWSRGKYMLPAGKVVWFVTEDERG